MSNGALGRRQKTMTGLPPLARGTAQLARQCPTSRGLRAPPSRPRFATTTISPSKSTLRARGCQTSRPASSGVAAARGGSGHGGGSSGRGNVAAAAGFSAAHSRWLPDQPTFLCPAVFAQQGSPIPSDETWAERGIFLSYGKAHLSYSDVEQLLQLANLDISPREFRAATAVVWAYRLRCPPQAGPTDAHPAPRSTERAPCPSWATARRTDGARDSRGARGKCSGSRGTGGSGGEALHIGGVQEPGGGGGSRALVFELVGFASADVTPWVAAAAASAVRGTAPAAASGAGDGAAIATASTATIWHLAVHPGLRRQGLGRALLERLVSELYGSHGASVVSLRSTSRSAAFYDRLGLVREPRAPLVRSASGGGSGGSYGAVV